MFLTLVLEDVFMGDVFILLGAFVFELQTQSPLVVSKVNSVNEYMNFHALSRELVIVPRDLL